MPNLLPKNFFKQNQKGFSILEIILASAIFITFASASVIAVVQGYNANRLGSEFTIANQFASEGIEAVRSIKNKSFTTLGSVDTNPRGLTTTGNSWGFDTSGTSDIFVNGKNYTRQVKIDPVNRDATPPLGNIVTSGTLDTDSKKVTSTVTWNFNTARAESVSLTTYLSDWSKAIAGSNGGPIMMAYSKTTTTPFYRTWNGSAWSAEASAQTVGGNINYIVLKSSRTRNEAALGTLDSNGNIYVQIWNGTTWGTPTLMANISATNSTSRSFDMDYEKSGDRLVVTYLATSTSADFAYRVWNGTSWTVASTITTPPTTGVIKVIETAQNPVSTSNEIAMIMIDANIDVYGMAWNGASWTNMGNAAVWDANASIATKKAVDVAYEQLSGNAMFIWGDSVSTDQYYRIWNGSTLTGATLLDIAVSGGVVQWLKLAPKLNSNEIMYAEMDFGADLSTRIWSGTAWDTGTQHPRHTQSAENVTSMVFDIVWETFSANSDKAWLLYGDGQKITAKQWSSTTNVWSIISTNVSGSSDDTSFIRLSADPTTGAIFAGIYESAASATDDIYESRLTGGGTTWSAKNSIWAGPISAEPVHFRIDIAVP